MLVVFCLLYLILTANLYGSIKILYSANGPHWVTYVSLLDSYHFVTHLKNISRKLALIL